MIALCLAALTLAAAPARGGVDGARIDKATGLHGARLADGVYRVELPRTELDVYAGASPVPARQGLTAWAAFQKTERGALMVGDFVLLEEQVDPAVNAALAGGLQVAALDRHFAGETPRVVDLHVVGEGSEAALAATAGRLFEVVRSKVASEAGPKLAELDTGKPADPTPAKLETTLGVPGKLVDGVYRVEHGRSAKLFGVPVGASMGVASWAAFSGADDQGAVTGAFPVEQGELQPLLKVLRANGLSITSIDAPWPGLQPALEQVHFWGAGPMDKLAKGFKAGLDKVK